MLCAWQTTAPGSVVWGHSLSYATMFVEDDCEVISTPSVDRQCQHWGPMCGPHLNPHGRRGRRISDIWPWSSGCQEVKRNGCNFLVGDMHFLGWIYFTIICCHGGRRGFFCYYSLVAVAVLLLLVVVLLLLVVVLLLLVAVLLLLVVVLLLLVVVLLLLVVKSYKDGVLPDNHKISFRHKRQQL